MDQITIDDLIALVKAPGDAVWLKQIQTKLKEKRHYYANEH
jgi:hypothetical protein